MENNSVNYNTAPQTERNPKKETTKMFITHGQFTVVNGQRLGIASANAMQRYS